MGVQTGSCFSVSGFRSILSFNCFLFPYGRASCVHGSRHMALVTQCGSYVITQKDGCCDFIEVSFSALCCWLGLFGVMPALVFFFFFFFGAGHYGVLPGFLLLMTIIPQALWGFHCGSMKEELTLFLDDSI
ncbi:hypothetical protein B0H65DRAFT_975 [Neurospora tetraspora]|uniref:Transmembrane protein n=1 Tax=Neurospora tetraspora TaxID=94610 RepID=A0AAE0JMM9_9PEZI|nr:hypothetical protein B0H65DRAFT_975 [Neurospora tetraspora]